MQQDVERKAGKIIAANPSEQCGRQQEKKDGKHNEALIARPANRVARQEIFGEPGHQNHRSRKRFHSATTLSIGTLTEMLKFGIFIRLPSNA
jgi:hypothetical protein